MNKYKICVYAIAKNEEKFVERWVNSMKEADEIYVLDTGSSDNTVKLLKKLGVKVKTRKIIPWRFDVARNESLKMLPTDTDICVCTDLDEVFKQGWRKKIESIWNKNVTRMSYNYNWSIGKNNIPLVSFYIEKIHSYGKYKWTHPVHEILTYIGDSQETIEKNEKITLNHYPDNAKSRSNYLSLLELSVKEDPSNDRNMHYLGREYMYHGKWNEAIDTLIKHIYLPSSSWKDERSASMRFISRCYINMNRFDEARMWLNKAIKEAPHLRDPLVEMMFLESQSSNWNKVIYFGERALKITNHEKTYINEIFSWNYTIYDLLSIAYHYSNNSKKALYYINIAVNLKKDNKRLIENKRIIEKKQ